MILSHSLGIIFLKTRKVAGTSLEIALSAHCGDTDIITPFGGRQKWLTEDEDMRHSIAGRGPQHFNAPISGMRSLVRRMRGTPPERHFWEHMPAQEIRNRIDPDIWTRYRKVSIVRNPFDFAVSNYYWFLKTGRTETSFETFIRTNAHQLRVNRQITHIDDTNVVDTMLRYEHLAQDVKALSNELNLGDSISDALLGVSSKGGLRSKARSTAEEFAVAPDLKDHVAKICAEDISEFEYTFPE
jgi:hypothetical protein